MLNLPTGIPFSLQTASDGCITLLSFKILMLLMVLLRSGIELTATGSSKPRSDISEVSEPSVAVFSSLDELAGLNLTFKPFWNALEYTWAFSQLTILSHTSGAVQASCHEKVKASNIRKLWTEMIILKITIFHKVDMINQIFTLKLAVKVSGKMPISKANSFTPTFPPSINCQSNFRLNISK